MATSPTIVLPGVVLSREGNSISRNTAVAPQVLTAATVAIVAGSDVVIPNSGLAVGAIYNVDLTIDKTAAGTATSAYTVGILPQDVAQTAAQVLPVLTFTKPAGTAAADVGVVSISVGFLTIGAAVAEAGSVAGTFQMTHNLAATGHAQVPTVVLAGVDTTTATILANRGGDKLVTIVTTGAGDVSSVLGVEAQLNTPNANSN